jgi:hypothetical protein
MPKQIHLFRGAPPVRSWSKYQATVKAWTLCGIARKGGSKDTECTEEPALVSCPHCLTLMRPAASCPASSQRSA